MFRERVSENIYVFTSDIYAQVTAGAIVTPEGAILIDSLPFPSESRAMATFLTRACPAGVRYVVLTHYHADHTYGAYLYPQAAVVAHSQCPDLLLEKGLPSLRDAQLAEPELEEVSLRSPTITFDEGDIALQLDEQVVRLIHAPGHTPDSILVYVEDERVLFAADTVMPVPSIVDGDIDVYRSSLKKILALSVENMVQGHGEVILRGEVDKIVHISLDYLNTIEEKVTQFIKEDKQKDALREIDIESCGLSRIPLNGLVQQIHQANLVTLYDQMK